MGRYEVSLPLMKAGVLSGYDITTEALLAKMMCLFGEYEHDNDTIRRLLDTSLAGEITKSND
jgi:L-asparaginase